MCVLDLTAIDHEETELPGVWPHVTWVEQPPTSLQTRPCAIYERLGIIQIVAQRIQREAVYTFIQGIRYQIFEDQPRDEATSTGVLR